MNEERPLQLLRPRWDRSLFTMVAWSLVLHVVVIAGIVLVMVRSRAHQPDTATSYTVELTDITALGKGGENLVPGAPGKTLTSAAARRRADRRETGPRPGAPVTPGAVTPKPKAARGIAGGQKPAVPPRAAAQQVPAKPAATPEVVEAPPDPAQSVASGQKPPRPHEAAAKTPEAAVGEKVVARSATLKQQPDVAEGAPSAAPASAAKPHPQAKTAPQHKDAAADTPADATTLAKKKQAPADDAATAKAEPVKSPKSPTAGTEPAPAETAKAESAKSRPAAAAKPELTTQQGSTKDDPGSAPPKTRVPPETKTARKPEPATPKKGPPKEASSGQAAATTDAKAPRAATEPTAVTPVASSDAAGKQPASGEEPSGKPTSAEPQPGEDAAGQDPRYAAAIERIRERVGQGQGGLGGAGDPSKVPSVGGVGTEAGGQIVGAEFLVYYNIVISRIREAWVWVGHNDDLAVRVRFQITGEGVIRNVQLGQSSGDEAYDESVLRAIKEANPLPPPPAAHQRDFGEVELTFRPGDVRQPG